MPNITTQSTHWFFVEVIIPPDWKNLQVDFRFDADNEAMIYSADGLPLQGLTGGGSGWRSLISRGDVEK